MDTTVTTKERTFTFRMTEREVRALYAAINHSDERLANHVEGQGIFEDWMTDEEATEKAFQIRDEVLEAVQDQ